MVADAVTRGGFLDGLPVDGDAALLAQENRVGDVIVFIACCAKPAAVQVREGAETGVTKSIPKKVSSFPLVTVILPKHS